MVDQEKKELFLLACARGLLDDVIDLLAHGVQPNIVDKDQRSGAHFAAAKGELLILQLLHSKGVDVDAEDKLGRSPMHYAALNDHESVISFLVTKSAWLDACDGTDCSALHLAARAGAAAAASRLLTLGARSNLRNQWDLTAFGEAIFRGHTNVCKALENSGFGVTDDDAMLLNGGYTLFHIAAASGNTQTLNWLLRHPVFAGSELVNDNKNPERLTPLHCMLLTGRLSIAGLQSLTRAGADVSAKDAKGHTPVSLLHGAVATPELKHVMAEVSTDTLYMMEDLLTPKGSILETAIFTRLAKHQHKQLDNAVTATNNESYSARNDASLSVAARLQAATCPEHVAAILESVNVSDQVHRVKVWAKLSLEEIHDLSCLTRHSKQCLEQVHHVTEAINRASAEGCLRRDEQFQEAMQDPAVRSIVDAVIQDPHRGPLVRDQQALTCLNKLRGLRDVLSLHSGGQISLLEVLRPWDNQDSQREAGMSAALDSNVEAAIQSLCNPKAEADEEEQGLNVRRAWANTHNLAVSEIQPAPPRERRESSTSAGWESEVDLHFDDTVNSPQLQPSVWHQTLKKVLQQMLVAGIILVILWTQGRLPSQLSTSDHAAAAV